MKIINSLIRKLGKDGYSIDKDLSFRDIIIISTQRATMLIRGLILKLKLKKSSGIIFLGKGTKIKYGHKISTGRSLTIGDNVEINALSKKGISIGNNVSILT